LPDSAAPASWHSAKAVAEAVPADAPMPDMRTAMLRGARGACPCCGAAPLFAGWLRVADTCRSCDAPLGQVRADDAPPYFTIFAVGHVIVPGMLWLERAHAPDLWIHAAIWLPLTLGLSLALMRPVKGATIGLMLKLGFGRPAEHG
jgi:uncharacterized protein (DUF983 family)